MNAKRLIGAAALIGILSSANAMAQSTTYWDFPTAFRAAAPTAAARIDTDPKIFESSLLHLQETHGVGLPSVKQTLANQGEGATCDIGPVAIVESSLINLQRTHGVGGARSSVVLAGRSADSRC